jgi:hypothetical protein
MAYNDDVENQIDQHISTLESVRKSLRRREKALRGRQEYLGSQQQYGSTNSIKSLKDQLQFTLPPYLMPGNVGGINEVTWPFYFQVDFDLGVNPTINSALVQNKFFQVTQESAFLLMAVEKAMEDTGLNNAPLQVEIIDRQSSRRFNNAPIPMQVFGYKGNPTIFPTPMLIMPNAAMDVTVTAMSGLNQPCVSSGVFQLSFFGYRIRVEDAGKVLSTIFG